MTKQFVATAFLLASLCAPASAFQKFEEYRIAGNEIRAVRINPPADENPATLVVELDNASQGDEQIVLESDDELDNCKATIESIVGDAGAYAQIVVHTTADTMNGVMVVQCVSLRNR